MKRKRFSEEQIMRILHEAEMLDTVRECAVNTIAPNRPCIAGGGSAGAWRCRTPSVSGRWSVQTRR